MSDSSNWPGGIQQTSGATPAAGATEDCSDAAKAIFHNVYVLVSRQENPAIFYNGKGNSLPTPKGVDIVEERKALGSIEKVAISSSDTVKEINRLLDLASAKRIAEEMDIVTYQSNAARLFDRVKDEFDQRLKAFELDQHSIDAMLTEIDNFRSPLKPAPTRQAVGNPDRSAADDTLLAEASKVLLRYRNFLDYARNYAERTGRDVYTEASVDAYKEATRPCAIRIEKNGLFAAKSALITGGLTGLAVAIAVVVFDNNLVLKNWIFAATAIAVIAAYVGSVIFEKVRRDNFMSALRAAIYGSVLENKAELGGNGADRANPTRMDRLLNTVRGRRSDQYFSFNKFNWNDCDKRRLKTDSKSKPLASELDAFVKTSSSRESVTFLGNALISMFIIALMLFPSYASGTLGRDKQFAFISRTTELGTCLLERGRVLLANGNSYFVETRGGNPVTEVDKSLVVRIEPVQLPEPDQADASKKGKNPQPVNADLVASTERVAKLPPCDTPREKTSDQTALLGAANLLADNIKGGFNTVADKLGQGTGTGGAPSLDGLVNATNGLAASVQTGLGAVADKLGKGTGQDDASPLARLVGATGGLAASIQEGAGRIAGTQPSPVVVPVIIDAPAAPASAPEAHAGPTFITQVYTAGGKVYDYGGGTMMLPIFLDPVTGVQDKSFGETGIDTPAKAFYFGLTSLTNRNLPNSEAKSALLREIAARYTDCMERTKAIYEKAGNAAAAPRLKLSIEGYASEDWKAARNDQDRRDLNLYLAEGRRAAIIEALGIDHALIDIDSKPPPATFGRWQDVDAGKVSRSFLFKDYDAMAARLDQRLPPLSKDGKQPSPDEKAEQAGILAHAAIISIEGETPPLCRPGAG
ncbi:hypothetical protein [Mesorhizobium sp. B2-3-4]|uniref:hypothetical protein n=1 Tax=Mesorhizobium sp. B2-3-4 TaxID=2589959 RepID=UPI00112D1AD0|nr:hypothetical protein [Mesorhizobium sp. B2-3-4]TPM28237.1 hypothetical protein FJ967_29075 [Mesorhizobium sp. B2-3-4]